MSLTLLTPVSTEPLTLEEAKDLLRLDGAHLDDDLASALVAARMEAEHYAGRSFAPQSWRLKLRDWWLGGLSLPRGPVNELAAITYLDTAGVWQTADLDAFTLDGDDLFIEFSYDPPRVQRRDAAIRIDFDAGLWDGDSDDTEPPEAIKRAIIMLAQSTFDSLSEQPQTLRERAFALLRPYRLDNGMKSS